MPATPYKVVVNHEEQYRLIPAAAKIPKGWRSPGLPPGTLEECRAQLLKVWKQAKPGEVEQAISEAEKRQP